MSWEEELEKQENERHVQAVISRNPRTIATKSEFYALYELGYFGNRALAWKSYEEVLASGWKGKICVRSKKGIDRKKPIYNFPIEHVLKEMKRRGFVPEESTFNQSMPDEHLLIQGEIRRIGDKPFNGNLQTALKCRGLGLRYTTVKKPMNEALREEDLWAQGLEASLILQRNLCSSSHSDIMDLLDIFPNDVIEFSTYDIAVGNIPGRNTVIWEVRNF